MKRSLLAVTLMAGLAAGCVWNPVNQSSQLRTASVPVSGFAQSNTSTIRLYAFNHQTGVDEEIDTRTARSSATFYDPDLFYYSFGSRVFAQKYWYNPAWGCSSGMLRLRVVEDGAALATFDQGQQDCVLDEMAAGDHPARAALDCGYAYQIVINSPSDC